jgi:hypothetical protein
MTKPYVGNLKKLLPPLSLLQEVFKAKDRKKTANFKLYSILSDKDSPKIGWISSSSRVQRPFAKGLHFSVIPRLSMDWMQHGCLQLSTPAASHRTCPNKLGTTKQLTRLLMHI